jgi:hypothetical protein
MTQVYAKNVATSAAEAAKVTPRAEFRVFGCDIIAALQPKLWNGRTVLQHARKMPAETYILSRRTRSANVKMRDELLDIKVKIGQTPDGFEIFQPAGKFQFPVSRDSLLSIAEALKVTLPADEVAAGAVDWNTFLGAVRSHPDLVAVTVEKMRWGFTIDGIICEYAQVWFNGALLESACVESDRHDDMKAVIEALGLDGHANTNYIEAAAGVVGLAAE